MPDLNRVQLMGRLTFDPELRRIPNGTAVSELRMAINRSWQGRDGDRREEVLYIDVTVWDRQAETCCQILRKGSLIFVEGALKMDQWDDKTTGEKRSKIRVQADRVQFLDSRREGGAGGGHGGDEEFSSAPPARESAPPRRGRPEPVADRGGDDNGPSRSGGGYAPNNAGGRAAVAPDQGDDDIPF
jgi:single-strand DNA-binding protein